jgi:thiol-disulfide isomerase/thioredoxin
VTSSKFNPEDLVKLVGPDANVKNPNGIITLVEFGDLDCPSCKRAYPAIEQMVANSNGKIRYVFHNLPLYGLQEHKGAVAGSIIAEIAAEKGKFWDYLHMVYGNADAEPAAPLPGPEDMVNFGQRIGLDPTVLHKRLLEKNDPAFVKVMHDLDLAREYRISNTPGFIVILPGHDNATVTGSEVFNVLDSEPYKSLLKGK